MYAWKVLKLFIIDPRAFVSGAGGTMMEVDEEDWLARTLNKVNHISNVDTPISNPFKIVF